MVNKVILIGNLGKDPEIRKLDNGNQVMNFSLATSESYKDKSGQWKENTEWHNVVFWGERDLKKGQQVYVEGKIQTRKWQDKDGHARYTTEIVAWTLRKFKSESNGTAQFSEPKQLNDLPF